MPPKSKRESDVPLLCSLCPKNPSFSDVSHLLTHIASKSHLSNRFKLQIRAQAEPDAKNKLEDFEFWYQQHNLDTLLADRLAAKDRKKVRTEKKNRALNGPALAPKAKREKKKPKEEEPRDAILESTPIYRAPVPRMHIWPTADSGKESAASADGWARNGAFETPTARHRVRTAPHDEDSPGDMLDPRLTTPYNREDDNADGKSTDSATKLKGILWPGMDLFDSATPEMKRMRNQKKGSNVMEQMMAGAAEIQPDEVSYFANWDHRATKDIFGPLSSLEVSPASEKEPTPKKRRTRKPTFVDLTTNVPRLRSARAKNTMATGSPRKRQPSMLDPPSSAVFLKPTPTLNPLVTAGFGQSFTQTEEEEEFKFTLGDLKHKKPFGIFQDGLEDSPGRTESSLEDHRFDFPIHGMPQFHHTSASMTSHISPTPTPKISSMRSYGKENSRPEINTGFSAQRPTNSASNYFPPYMFHEANSNPLYVETNQSYVRSFPYGETNLNFSENTKHSGYGSSFHSDFRSLPSINRPINGQSQASASNGVSGLSNSMHFGM